MNLQDLLTQLDTPIVIRPTPRRMTQGELETYLDKAGDSSPRPPLPDTYGRLETGRA